MSGEGIKRQWDVINDGAGLNQEFVRRIPVPGGWLYLVQHVRAEDDGPVTYGWHPPVFVPEVKS